MMIAKLLTACLFALLLQSTAFAAASPVEGNPVFRAWLASFLELEGHSDLEKTQRFDQFITILENSFGPHSPPRPVSSLEQYIQLRNAPLPSPRVAFQVYAKEGLVTPLSIQASPGVSEQILRYEAQEMTDFIAFAKSLGPKSEDSQRGLPQGLELLQQLPELYLLGQSMKDSLAKTSNDFAAESFAEAERLRQQGSPRGIFSWMLGVGAASLSTFGEVVVNPLVQQTAFNPLLKSQLQQKALSEISRLKLWPSEKKLALIARFHQGLQQALDQQVRNAQQRQEFLSLAEHSSLVEVIRSEFLPKYFQRLSARQKAQAVWQVFGSSHFAQKAPAEQAWRFLSALGPVIPQLLRQMAKVTRFPKTTELAWIAQDHAEPLSAAAVTRLENTLNAEARLGPGQSLSLDPMPLAMTPLKITLSGELRSEVSGPAGKGPRRVVFQVLRPEISETLKADLQILEALKADQHLMMHLQQAGFSGTPALIESLSTLVQEEANLKWTAEKQQQALAPSVRSFEILHEGQRVQVEVIPAKVLQVAKDGTWWLQEFAPGQAIDAMGFATDPSKKPLVDATLKKFAEKSLQAALNGEGLLWAEPTTKNMRVETLENGQRVRLHLFNFGSSGIVTTSEVKNLFMASAKLPLKEWQQGSREKSLEAQNIAAKLQQALDAGVVTTPATLRLAQAMLHLRDLMGPAAFENELLHYALKNPSLLWAPLGARWKEILKDAYAPLQNWLGLRRTAPRCELLF